MKVKNVCWGLLLALPMVASAATDVGPGAPALSPEAFDKVLASLPTPNAAKGAVVHNQQFCGSCHGEQGYAPTANWPHVAGQPFEVTAKALLDFRDGRRQGGAQAALMSAAVKHITNQEIADVAAYYETLAGPDGTTLETGKGNMPDTSKTDVSALIKKGDPARAITPCAACHGTTGKGRANGSVPVLHGQNPVYLAAQLRDYRDNNRTNDMLKEMRFFAQKLTDDEINALANFYADQKGWPGKPAEK